MFYGYKCTNCDSTYNLQVHHNNYNCIGNEKISDVIVLCKHCHYTLHDSINSTFPFGDPFYDDPFSK